MAYSEWLGRLDCFWPESRKNPAFFSSPTHPFCRAGLRAKHHGNCLLEAMSWQHLPSPDLTLCCREAPPSPKHTLCLLSFSFFTLIPTILQLTSIKMEKMCILLREKLSDSRRLTGKLGCLFLIDASFYLKRRVLAFPVIIFKPGLAGAMLCLFSLFPHGLLIFVLLSGSWAQC